MPQPTTFNTPTGYPPKMTTPTAVMDSAPVIVPGGEPTKRLNKRPRKDAAPAPSAPKEPKVNTPAAGTDTDHMMGMEEKDGGSQLVVAKAVRTMLKNASTPMHCGSDALPALNAHVNSIIQEAMTRSLSNGRKTLKACDF